MNFRDHWVSDADGNQFIFTVEMQRKLSNMGLPIAPTSLDHLANQHIDRIVAQLAPPPADVAPTPRPVKSEPRPVKIEPPPPSTTFKEPESIQIDPETGKYLGRMKWFNAQRGYGFIARGGGEDIFFHKTAAIDDPTNFPEGQWVLYDVEQRKKGIEATDVELFSGEVNE